MSEQFYTILTNIGKAKIANAISLGSEINLVRFLVGDSNGSYYNPTEEQTELRRKVWETNAISVVNDEKNPNWIKIEAIIPGDVGGFTVREVGIFDDKNEMIAVGKIAEIYKPISENGSTKDVIIRIIIEVSNASVVTIKVDPTVMIATKKDIEVVESKFKKITGDKNELVTKDKSNLVAAINEVATGLNTIELTGTKVTIEDTDNNFTSPNVEGALKELATKDKTLQTNIDNNKKEVDKEITDLKQSVSSGKQLIATAVTGKDVQTNGSDSFQKMADNIDSIKTKLPILEGDAGVAEDIEGNVYGVGNIEEREIYPENIENMVTLEWQYSLSNISCVESDSFGNIYIGTDQKVIKLDKDKNSVWEYPILNVQGIALNQLNEIYICTKQKVIKLNKGGFLELEFAVTDIESITIDNKGDIYLINIMKSSGDKKVYKYNQTGELFFERTFKYCMSIFVDSHGFIYACQYNLGDIYKVSPENQLLWTYTHSPTGDYVAADSNGYIYVNGRGTGYSAGVAILSSNGILVSDLRVIGSPYTKLINGTRGRVFGTNATYIRKLMRGMIVFEYKISNSTIRKIDNEGLIYLSNSSSLIVLRDNYTLEKVAVLKEREVR